MRYLCWLLAGALTFVLAPSAKASDNPPNFDAKAAILLEAETGRVIYEKNADQSLPMASTTKVLTALLAIENGNLNETIVVPPQCSGIEGSSMYLEPNEHITLEDLLYGLMMWSGNDAAVTIATHIGGSVEGFAGMMNDRARELGATNSNFVNPHGLPNDQHYTSARDLGMIACYAIKNEQFRTIVSTKSRRISWEGHEYDRVLENKNKMLSSYDGANGIKTGFTKSAGRCLVSGAERNGIQLVTVVINCPDMYAESSKMLDYGFSMIEDVTALQAGTYLGKIEVLNGIETDSLELFAKHDIVLAMHKDDKELLRTELEIPESIEAPVEKGQKLGTVRVYLADQLIGEEELFAEMDVRKLSYGFYLDKAMRDWLSQEEAIFQEEAS